MSEEMQLELEHTLKTMRELKEAADTITTLRADLQKLNERNAEYIGTIDRLRRRVAETDVEIERLRAALDVVRASGLLIGSTTLHDKVRAVVHAALAQEKPND
jgi:chromosome segregation ATPase